MNVRAEVGKFSIKLEKTIKVGKLLSKIERSKEVGKIMREITVLSSLPMIYRGQV